MQKIKPIFESRDNRAVRKLRAPAFVRPNPHIGPHVYLSVEHDDLLCVNIIHHVKHPAAIVDLLHG